MMLMVNGTMDANFPLGQRLQEREKGERFRDYFRRITSPSTCETKASPVSHEERLAMEMKSLITETVGTARLFVLATTVMKASKIIPEMTCLFYEKGLKKRNKIELLPTVGSRIRKKFKLTVSCSGQRGSK